MTKRFDKDAWIRAALRIGYLKVERSGVIWRRKFCSKDGQRMSFESAVVTPQVHKKSGRVYFNMTFLGITKSVLVNRVVAWAFLPNPLNLPQVNHKNGDKENNAISNLEWSSSSDNEKHAHRTGLKSGRGSQNANAKLGASDVLWIRENAARVPIAQIAVKYGVARSTIINIVKRNTWSHL